MNKAKHAIWALLTIMILALLTACGTTTIEPQDYLRLHIRANSDTAAEQQVKLAVRDAVVAYITPLAGTVDSKEQMQRLLADKIPQIEAVANEVLQQNGYDYTAHAYLSHEEFPTRTYDKLTLPQGDYDALIVQLGSGQGANWWCVAFPPLCFVAAEDTEGDEIEYRSAIAEWFAKHCKED